MVVYPLGEVFGEFGVDGAWEYAEGHGSVLFGAAIDNEDFLSFSLLYGAVLALGGEGFSYALSCAAEEGIGVLSRWRSLRSCTQAHRLGVRRRGAFCGAQVLSLS